MPRCAAASAALAGTAADPEVLRLLPPLSLSLAEADVLLLALAEVLS